MFSQGRAREEAAKGGGSGLEMITVAGRVPSVTGLGKGVWVEGRQAGRRLTRGKMASFRFVQFEPLLSLRGLSFLHNTETFGSMPGPLLNCAGHP